MKLLKIPKWDLVDMCEFGMSLRFVKVRIPLCGGVIADSL